MGRSGFLKQLKKKFYTIEFNELNYRKNESKLTTVLAT